MEEAANTVLKHDFKQNNNYINKVLKNVNVSFNNHLVKDKEKELCFEILITNDITNEFDGVHGAFLSALTDCLPSVLPLAKGIKSHTTIELQTTFLRSIPMKAKFYCLSKINKIGNKVLFLECEYYDFNYKLCAKGKITKYRFN